MKSEILHVLSYYDLFEYAPTLHEIFISLRVKSTMKDVQSGLSLLSKQGIIVSEGNRYARRKSIILAFKRKKKYSIKLNNEFRVIQRFFSLAPTVSLIGISGSLSMMDADTNDDIDLFVVTAQDTLWLSRFYILLVTRIMSIFGNSTAQKLCWNIFMEEKNLALPPKKQNEYTAHELVQLKVIYDKSHVAQKLQKENMWITKILPNVQINYKKIHGSYRQPRQYKYLKFFDNIVRFFQRKWLYKKGYRVIEYPSQVWFIQSDFEQKIPFPLKKV